MQLVSVYNLKDLCFDKETGPKTFQRRIYDERPNDWPKNCLSTKTKSNSLLLIIVDCVTLIAKP